LISDAKHALHARADLLASASLVKKIWLLLALRLKLLGVADGKPQPSNGRVGSFEKLNDEFY